MMGKLQRIVLATAMVATLPAANAAERVDVDRVVGCAKEQDDARRLACYDDAVAVAKKPAREAPVAATKPEPAKPAAPAASVTPPAPPAPTPAPAVSTESDFGVTGSAVARQREAEKNEQQGESGKIESITAQVTAVSAKPYGELVITLDNGQVWAQKKTERYFAAKPGDTATINAGMLGSYRMIIGNRSTAVTRIK